jgi:hypothetical protein
MIRPGPSKYLTCPFFAPLRRSTAVFQIAIIRKLGGITDEELGRFEKELRALLAYFRVEDHGRTAAK